MIGSCWKRGQVSHFLKNLRKIEVWGKGRQLETSNCPLNPVTVGLAGRKRHSPTATKQTAVGLEGAILSCLVMPSMILDEIPRRKSLHSMSFGALITRLQCVCACGGEGRGEFPLQHQLHVLHFHSILTLFPGVASDSIG